MRPIHLALILATVISLSACTTAMGDARDIVHRPNRQQEEFVAWHPTHTEPLQTLLTPNEELRSTYPTTTATLPGVEEIGRIAWMDNRYLITSASHGFKKDEEEVNSSVVIVDAETGKSYLYKRGGFECYKRGFITYQAGSKMGFIRAIESNSTFFWGTLGKERGYPAWVSRIPNDRVRTGVDPDICEEPHPVSVDKVAPPASDLSQVLRLENGAALAIHPSEARANFGKTQTKVYWIKPNGEMEETNLLYPSEIGINNADNFGWAPWLGKYIITGEALRYSLAPSAIQKSRNQTEQWLGQLGNIVIFDPSTGEVTRVARPTSLLKVVQVYMAYATKKGFLWQSQTTSPWGLYLSNDKSVRQISDLHVARMAMSPDGCKAAVVYFQKQGFFDSPQRLQFINFCTRE